MNKASGGDGIPVEKFQILKHDAVKMLEKVSFHSSPKEGAMSKSVYITAQLHSSHTLAK